MVVVHRAFGFRFVIYTDDHEPAHVHLVGAGFAKINLFGPGGRPEVVDVRGVKRAEMRRLYAEVEVRREALIEQWERIHGPADRR